MRWSDVQCIELFHLQVLRLLAAGREGARIALKGGCNLRFFFGSARYSADMDLDVEEAVAPYALKERMDSLLAGAALQANLRAAGIQVARVSAPKQTETTQRWKVSIRPMERPGAVLHTKIEFSRRAGTREAVIEPVNAAVIAEYGLPPLLVRHYPLNAALRQKVRALVDRAVVQARDVFDLAVLLPRAAERAVVLAEERSRIPQAIERVMEVSYDDFRGQVAAFLHPVDAAQYGSAAAWDALRLQVVEILEEVLR